MKVLLETLVASALSASMLSSPATARGAEWSTFVGGAGWDSSSLYHGVATLPGGDVILVGGTTSHNFPTTPGAYQTDHAGTMGLNIGDAFLARVRADGSALVWSTFFGGSADEMATAVAVHPNGEITIVGWTNSVDLPVTPDAFQDRYNGKVGQGPGDAFVAHFDPSKTGQAQLVWATYLGAERNDIAFDLGVSPSGEVYVGGWTQSPGFPMRGRPFQPGKRGGRDFFIARLGARGSELEASTFLGGLRHDELYSLALDSQGNVAVCGRTLSTATFPETRSDRAPVTPNAFQSHYGGGQRDTYVARLDRNLSKLQYATFLGGNRYDGGSELAIDGEDRIVVHGWTDSHDHPVTADAFQPEHTGGIDAVISMLDPRQVGPDQLVWSTFLGGSGHGEYPNGLVVSDSGRVTVCGTTGATDFPTTKHAFQPSFGGGLWDGFVTQFDPSRSGSEQVVYSTYVGDARTDIAYSIAETADGGIVVTGRTNSPDFPVRGTIQPDHAGNFDSYLIQLNIQ